MKGIVLALLLCIAPGAHAACTVSSASANLGSQSSFALEAAPTAATQTASGLSCDPALIGLATPAHIKVQVSTGLPGGVGTLTGPDGITLPFRVATTPNGTPLADGNEVVFVSQASLVGGLLGLFAGPSSSIPLYVDAGPATALKAGTYTGTVALRWYYYTCSGIGALGICLGQSSSPGFGVNLLGQVTNWGSGTPALLNVALTVTADCAITAPDVDFGSAPLVSAFDPVTQTLYVRCTRDQPYTVGLSDGTHALGTQRRLQGGANLLLYELFDATTSARWGSVGAERRASADADVNGGVLDGISAQGFTYRAEILSSQPTPPAGLYTDDVQVLVEF